MTHETIALEMPSTTPRTDATRRSPRERLLEAAGELFYAEGVQSVGIDRVIERAGVAKASLYSTFGSKEELVRAYLDERHARIIKRLRTAVDAVDPGDPAARILAVFDAQAQLFPRPDYRGCAFVAASAEAPRGGRVEEATHAFRDELRRLFTELATAAGVSDPSLLASQLQLVYDGAGAAANLDRNAQIGAPARAAAAALIAASLELPPKRDLGVAVDG
jgi:AcrR family transcriptional regulator